MTTFTTPDGMCISVWSGDADDTPFVGVLGGRIAIDAPAIDGRAIDVTALRELPPGPLPTGALPELRPVAATGMVTVTLADWRPPPLPAPESGHALTLRLDPESDGALSTVVAVDADGKPIKPK